jgi:hypothetical protein
MKYVLYFLAVLLVLFIIKGVFFGIYLFIVVLKYMVIAGLVAGVIYLFNRKTKKNIE